MIIKYIKGSVLTNDGFRNVEITARAVRVSAMQLKVVDVIEIDGCGCGDCAPLDGSKRQQFNVSAESSREIDKIKNLSSCEILVG